MAWRKRLRPFYVELGIDPDEPIPAGNRAPFDDAFCQLVEEVRPEIVSFHFGLPVPALARPRQGDRSQVISSATTVREAIWLEEHGCDAIIAQGFEAGGHRGIFRPTMPTSKSARWRWCRRWSTP
jgi:nitronate monooxygenase